MKLVAISDTHGNHDKLNLPEDGDVLVHTGDFTAFGKGDEYFIEWFTAQPQPHKILLVGNHETHMSDLRLKHLGKRNDLILLEPQHGRYEIEINGVVFSLPAMNRQADVVLFHYPPEGIFGAAGQIAHQLKYEMSKHDPPPKLFITGHWHEQRGTQIKAGTKYINASCYFGEKPFVETI